jgi:hypothetical protein
MSHSFFSLNMLSVLNPSKKAQWLEHDKWSEANIEKAKKLTLAEFIRRYPLLPTKESSSIHTQGSKSVSVFVILYLIWLILFLQSNDRDFYINLTRRGRDSIVPYDSLESFWSEPKVDLDDISLWAYLETQRKDRPRLTQFQLDVLSAPCSSPLS